MMRSASPMPIAEFRLTPAVNLDVPVTKVKENAIKFDGQIKNSVSQKCVSWVSENTQKPIISSLFDKIEGSFNSQGQLCCYSGRDM